MPSRSVLVIGGTGEISAACCHRAVELGMDVTALNRGRTTARPLPSDVRVLTGWTVIERMRRGKPVVVHGDGTSMRASTR
jgi:NAD(P)-dependent dehydrogenase (short-subunit alcohol dehydrogenase family)